jgi:phosphatidate cytidylyltransferase
VAGVQPAGGKRPGLAVLTGRGNLLLRVVSSLLLAPIAIAAAYFGGMVFIAFWAIAALAVLWEWDTLVCTDDRNAVLATGVVAIAGSALLMSLGRSGVAMALIALGFFAVAGLGSRLRRFWCAAGVVYAAAVLIAPVLLRHDSERGFAAILFLFAVVWLTDIAAYFAGRGIGGPKLMARVSPNKTWSGAIGGTLAGVLGGVAVARGFGIEGLAAVAGVAVVLSVVSQAGDLVESAIKRHFNAKDASQLIPGHGGLMDRLDGFVAAAAVGAVIGIAHGGFDAPARGLMVW